MVWTVLLDESLLASRLGQYEGLLNAGERERALRFRQPADRVRFTIGRALARTLLSSFAAIDRRTWRFRIGSHGRPELEMTGDLARLRFNLSHTDGLLACTAAIDCDVGVDVERIDRTVERDVAGRYFSPKEVADLRALPDEAQPRVFFDYWTLKEAYIKARGLGLAIPLDRFSFALRPPAEPCITFEPDLDDDPSAWHFVQASPTPRHRLGLAIRSGSRRRRVRFQGMAAEALVA